MARDTPGLREAIIDKFQRYLGRTPDEATILQFMDGHDTGEQVGATIANSEEYRNTRDLTPDGTGTTTRPPGGYTGPRGVAGDPEYDANPRDYMANRDKGAWRSNLVDYLVRTKGIDAAYANRLADEEIGGIEAAVRNERNIGADPNVFIEQAKRKLDGRVANSTGPAGTPPPNTPGGGGTGTPGGGGTGGGGTGSWFGDTYGSAAYSPFMDKFSHSLGPYPADIMTPWTEKFEMPDLSAEGLAKNPVVQARIKLGRDAIEAGNAKRGTFFTPGMLKAVDQYAGDVASTEAQSIFDRELSKYMTNFSTNQSDKARRGSAYSAQGMQDFNVWGQNFNINKDNQTTPFGMKTQMADIDLRKRGVDNQGRGLDLQALGLQYGRDNDVFNWGQTGKMNDFNIHRGYEQDRYNNLFQAWLMGQRSGS